MAVSVPFDRSKGVTGIPDEEVTKGVTDALAEGLEDVVKDWADPRNGHTNKAMYKSFLIGLKIKKASHYGMPLIKKIYKTALFGGS